MGIFWAFMGQRSHYSVPKYLSPGTVFASTSSMHVTYMDDERLKSWKHKSNYIVYWNQVCHSNTHAWSYLNWYWSCSLIMYIYKTTSHCEIYQQHQLPEVWAYKCIYGIFDPLASISCSYSGLSVELIWGDYQNQIKPILFCTRFSM